MQASNETNGNRFIHTSGYKLFLSVNLAYRYMKFSNRFLQFYFAIFRNIDSVVKNDQNPKSCKKSQTIECI
jgi:hypothetical protein